MPSTPRKDVFIEGEVGGYHCYNRTVRQGFLCGFDAATGRDYSDRRDWIVDFQRELAAWFAIEVCRYAFLANHFHTILRVRPDIAGGRGVLLGCHGLTGTQSLPRADTKALPPSIHKNR